MAGLLWFTRCQSIFAGSSYYECFDDHDRIHGLYLRDSFVQGRETKTVLKL